MRRFRLFDLVEELWDSEGYPKGEPLKMEVYRNKRGDMIDCRHRRKRSGLVRFIVRNGIHAVKSRSRHSVCSIGRSDITGKWYGWSHRAIVGFGLGDRIFEERFGNDHTPFIKHGKKTIKTSADARLAATRFAASVS